MTNTSIDPDHLKHLAIFMTHKWGEWVETNPEKLVEFYHTKALLIPTFSDKFAIGRDEIAKYFTNLLIENPTLTVEFVEIIPQIGENWIMTNGIYIFHGQESTLARFSFLFGFCPNSEQWHIITHHSSVMPAE